MSNRSRASRGRTWALLVVASITLLQLQLVFAPTASADQACQGAFSGSPVGSLAMTASVADGSDVAPGQTIDFTITWDPNDWSSLDRFANCFSINGTIDDSLTYEEKPPANDGGIDDSVVVPINLNDGDSFCVRARLSGQPAGGNTTTQKSNKLCYTIRDVPQLPDVEIKKTASKGSVAGGESFSFTLTAKNVSTVTANNVVIKDTVPSRFAVDSVAGAGCSATGQVVECDPVTLGPGATKVVTINVTATVGACATIDNTATVTAMNDTNPNNNSDQATVSITCDEPDVKIAKASSTASVNVDGSVTFTLTVQNTGSAAANDVVVTDTIATGMQITDTSGCNNAAPVSGQTVTCQLGNIPAGGSKSFTITVKATAAACPRIDNDATVSASNEPNANKGNNTSNLVIVDVICPDPDVKIVKRSDAPVTGLAPGESFTYTIRVENVGGADATNVVVTDTIPDGLIITAVSAECTFTGQDVECDLGTVAAGDAESVTITVEATEDACPDVTNTATVTAGNEPAVNAGNNTSNPVTDLVNCTEPGLAVRIVKTNDADRDGDFTDNEEARRPDADVQFLLVITNTGEVPWKITDLTDEFDGQTVNLLTGKCADLDGLELQPGESETCRFTMNNYSPPADTTLVNTVEVCVEEMGGNRTDCDDDPSRVRSRDVLGRTITPTKTPPGGTAFTGSNGTLGFGAIALGLLMLGSGLVWAGYRRRQQYDG